MSDGCKEFTRDERVKKDKRWLNSLKGIVYAVTFE